VNYILDDDGNPVPCSDLLTWAKWFEDDPARMVAKTKVGDQEVSTVFLGLDHGWGTTHLPVLWETLVFPECEECERYTSRADALAGHTRHVATLLAKDPTP